MSPKEFTEEEEPASFSPIKIVLITLGILILLAVTVTGIGGYYIYSGLQAVNPQAEEKVEVEVPLGSSTAKIASILKENKLIKNEKIFYYYARYQGANDLQAGQYSLSPASTVEELIQQLKEGKVGVDAERFTIPEGLSIVQIAAELEKDGLVEAQKFLTAVNEADFSQFSFVQDIPDVPERTYRLEGYLFPDTYEVPKGATAEEIISIMLAQFEKEIKPEWLEELAKRKMSLYEAVTLASIVEREAVLDEERKTIAGIFTNRLRDNWLLQSCATVQFVLGKQRDVLLFEDLEVKSPYNTYLNSGLPPSPIASPGRRSLEAVVYPEDHPYFFFVTKKDGTGAHYFSKTYEEHLSHDAQSRGNF